MERRPLEALIDNTDPAWPLVAEWMAASPNQPEVLPVDRAAGEETLLELQVTSHSCLGAVALETGGILFNHGWLRFLGAGHSRIAGSLLTWNGYRSSPSEIALNGAMIVAYDLGGGFFAMNGGAFEGKTGDIWYLAPDTLEWEPLERGYTDFLYWAAVADLNDYYANVRWSAWEAEARAVGAEQVIGFYPPLWAKCELAERSRRPVSVYEHWKLTLTGWNTSNEAAPQ